jgi:UDP-4-amino-4,6-dideoxy-N-acetyl-beta-L-altrosamine transaminase
LVVRQTVSSYPFIEELSTEFIPYAKQTIEADDIRAVSEVLSGDFLTTGPAVDAFEKKLAEFCGARYAVAVSSGTAALHLACLALGLGEKDAIVTSPITFLATANCARYVGADVVFADIDPASANLSVSSLSQVLKDHPSAKKIKAVFPVHFAGQPCDMEKIADSARSKGLKIVEDAAHALGAEYQTSGGEWVRVGSCRHSDMTVFSFHPVKHITTGEGGAITTQDPVLYERLKRLRSHGMVRDDAKGAWHYEMNEVGFNYRITDIQCALGKSQLEKLPRFLSDRRKLAQEYITRLERLSGGFIRPLGVSSNAKHAYHLFVVRVPFEVIGTNRTSFMNDLKAKGIGTQLHYIPVHTQPYYRKLAGENLISLPHAEKYFTEALSLPLYPGMPEDGVERVVRALEAALPARV